MDQELLQYGFAGVIVLYLIQQGITLIKWFATDKGKNGYEKKTYEIASQISNNHLEHIYREIQKQTSQHDKQLEVLTQIKTILEERKH